MKRVCKKCFPKGLDYAIKQGRSINSLICICRLMKKTDRAINKAITKALFSNHPQGVR